MSFEKRLRTEPGFEDHLRRSVKIDGMSPEELLSLSPDIIQSFSGEELGAAMEKIMHGFNHLALDEHNRTITDPRWRYYIEAAVNKSQ